MNYDALQAAAAAKRDKSVAPRWNEMDKRTTVANFLSTGDKHTVVEVLGKKPAYIVSQLNAIIKADNLSELVFAVEYEGNATLVSFATEPVEDN
jgi:hypothetical protein